VRSAAVALVAAAVFFAGVLAGASGRSSDRSPPQPVVLEVVGGGAGPGESGEGRNGPPPDSLDVQEVEHEVREGEVEDYDDGGGAEDNSGPGSVDDSSGPGSGEPDPDDDSGHGSDSSGPGSDSSGSGSDSSGSGSSGPGSDGSGSG
jgi:hypothetical protein